MAVQIVLGNASRRGAFNQVFEKAQEQLQHVFGMEMIELPAKEKVTIAQKRGNLAYKPWIPQSQLIAYVYSRTEILGFFVDQVLDCDFHSPPYLPFTQYPLRVGL